MYHPGQIIHDLTNNKPRVAYDWDFSEPIRNTHYITNTGKGYEIFLPESIRHAKILLAKNIIVPSPVPPTHHWRCRNWLTNHERGHCSCSKELKYHNLKTITPAN